MGKKILLEAPVECEHVKPLGLNGCGAMEWFCGLLAETWENRQPQVVSKNNCKNKNCYLFERFLQRAKRVWGKDFKI